MKTAKTFSLGVLRNPRIEPVLPMASMAATNSNPARRWMSPPFFVNRAIAPRMIASPPAVMWIAKSMRPPPLLFDRAVLVRPKVSQSTNPENDGKQPADAQRHERPDKEKSLSVLLLTIHLTQDTLRARPGTPESSGST